MYHSKKRAGQTLPAHKTHKPTAFAIISPPEPVQGFQTACGLLS